MDTAHSLLQLYLCNMFIYTKLRNPVSIVDSQVENWYLQSGSVHIPGQFSSPSTGYHEHFIGIHLQKETLISEQVTPS